MKKRHIEYEGREENAFSLSTGDLMAGLLFIFILLLMGALLQVQKNAEQDEEIVKKYDKTAENGGYPPTQNGDIRSLFWLFSLMALQN